MIPQILTGKAAKEAIVKVYEDEGSMEVVVGYYLHKNKRHWMCFCFPGAYIDDEELLESYVSRQESEEEALEWCRDELRNLDREEK